jgi:hypothetical protein
MITCNAWHITIFQWFPMVSMAFSASVVALVTQTSQKLVGLRTFANAFCVINLQRGNFYPVCIRCEYAGAYLVSEIFQHSFMVCEINFGDYAAWRSEEVSTFRLIFRLIPSG